MALFQGCFTFYDVGARLQKISSCRPIFAHRKNVGNLEILWGGKILIWKKNSVSEIRCTGRSNLNDRYSNVMITFPTREYKWKIQTRRGSIKCCDSRRNRQRKWIHIAEVLWTHKRWKSQVVCWWRPFIKEICSTHFALLLFRFAGGKYQALVRLDKFRPLQHKPHQKLAKAHWKSCGRLSSGLLLLWDAIFNTE